MMTFFMTPNVKYRWLGILAVALVGCSEAQLSGGGMAGGNRDAGTAPDANNIPPPFGICGNGTVDGTEACDDAGESATCNRDCTLAVCGDGQTNGTAGETCDDMNTNDGDGCSASCQTESNEERIKDFSLGMNHTCILLESGKVRCWGSAWDGRLGYARGRTAQTNLDIGDNEPAWMAGDVDIGGRVVQIDSGFFHSCALLDTGGVRCWGWAFFGMLGYGNTEDIGDDETPASAGDVPLGGRAVQIAVGVYHSCALLDTGAVRCWGENTCWGDTTDVACGRLGYGHTDRIGDDETPEEAGDVPLGARAVEIFAGGLQNCARLETGEIKCWGANPDGALGQGDTVDIGDDEPASDGPILDFGEPIDELALGGQHACARHGTRLRCWGHGEYGQLGLGDEDNVGDDELASSVEAVDLGRGAKGIALGVHHSCIHTEVNSVRCFGANLDGQLGLGHSNFIGDDEVPSTQPPADLGGPVRILRSGGNHNCALMEWGGLRCWGLNDKGQLGYGHTRRVGDDETPASQGDVPVFRPE